MQLGISLGLRHRPVQPTWSPADLGAALVDYWDAERDGSLYLSGNQVSDWEGRNGRYVYQSVGGSKPVYSATSFNGRPGLTFDGIDDYLELSDAGNMPGFPIGAEHGEIWVLASQLTPGATTGGKIFAGYAGGANSNRRVGRTSVTGVNRAFGTVGRSGGSTTATNAAVDYSGGQILRGVFSPTGLTIHVGATGMTEVAAVPTSGATAFYIGSNSGTQQFANGVMSALVLTKALTADQATALSNFLSARL